MIRVVGDASQLPLPTVDWDGQAPETIVQALAVGSPYRNNMQWFDEHAQEIFEQHPNLYYCVAGQELFVRETPQSAREAALAKHPHERGLVYSPVLPRPKGSTRHAV